MSQKLLADGFKQIKKLSEYDEHFVKYYDENNDKGYILKVDVKYPENLFNLHSDLPFLFERKKILEKYTK